MEHDIINIEPLAEIFNACDADEGWARGMHQLHDAYIDYLSESLFEDAGTENTISGQYFCGCDVCWTREILSLVVSQVVDACRKGLVR